jgi:hypothetical protein
LRNVPKPLCQEHHGFGCLLKLFWFGILSNTLLTIALRFLLMVYMCVCSNKQEDTIIEHTSTICKINKMIDCNVPDLASLGNVANVCVGSEVYNI